ncbi:MAG: hypothetical protein Q9226_009145 [Calogaya cf. arnoldii]
MYLRGIHADATIPTLRNLIRANPLGLLTTAIPSKTHATILSSHIPFLLDIQDEDSPTELGILRGHLSRPNPQSKTMIESLESQHQPSGSCLADEVLVVFTSPVQHYVTPKFYTSTKPRTGKVVPTWNYAAAQVYGHARVFFDSKAQETVDYLSKQIADLTRFAEEGVMGHVDRDREGGHGSDNVGPKAWKVDDAPDRYIELLRKNIIGVEIVVERLEGKFKMSQEMGSADREGIVKGFAGLDTEVGHQMANLVSERGELKDAKSG